MALRLWALALLASVHSLHLTRQQVLRSVSLSPLIALPAFADDDLKGLLGAVVENEEAKQAKRDADAALEEKLSKMSAGERIRYERAEAAKTNKAAADEAMRKIKTLVGDQDAADAKPAFAGSGKTASQSAKAPAASSMDVRSTFVQRASARADA